MSVKRIIKEAVDKNPLALKEAVEAELRSRLAIALEAKMKESDDEEDEDEDEDEDDEDELDEAPKQLKAKSRK
jgi:galactokinase/mevalonate kinase-like predicted kinase